MNIKFFLRFDYLRRLVSTVIVLAEPYPDQQSLHFLQSRCSHHFITVEAIEEVTLAKFDTRGEIVVEEIWVSLMQIIADDIEEETMKKSYGACRNGLKGEVE